VGQRVTPEGYRAMVKEGLIRGRQDLEQIAQIIDQPPANLPYADVIDMTTKSPLHERMKRGEYLSMWQDMMQNDPASTKVLLGITKRHDNEVWKRISQMNDDSEWQHIFKMKDDEVLAYMNRGDRGDTLAKATNDAIHISKAQPHTGGSPTVSITPPRSGMADTDLVATHRKKMEFSTKANRVKRHQRMAPGNEEADRLANKDYATWRSSNRG